MAREPGFFDVADRLRELSAKGDGLERLSAVVDFELFRADLGIAQGTDQCDIAVR